MCDTIEPLNQIHIEDICRSDGFIVEEAAEHLTWILVCPPGNLRLGAAPPPLPSEGRAYVVYQPQWETMDVYATFLAFQNNPCPHRSRGSKWMAVGQQIADAHALLGKFKEAPKVSIWFHK